MIYFNIIPSYQIIDQWIRAIEDAFIVMTKTLFVSQNEWFQTSYWCKKFAEDYWISINQDIKSKSSPCPKKRKMGKPKR